MKWQLLSILVLVLGFGCNGTIGTGDPGENNLNNGNNVLNNGNNENNVLNNANNLNNENNVIIPEECGDADAIYERRIEPLVTGGQPSSCNQCHLAGVSLDQFVQDTPCETMACLITLDLVDLESPEDSRILEQILLAEPDSELITEAVIQAEYDGFLAWIQSSAVCHEPTCGEFSNPCGGQTVTGPDPTLTPIGECDPDELNTSFQNLVYSQRGRCASCHAVGREIPPNGSWGNAGDPSWPEAWIDLDESDPAAASERTMFNMLGIPAMILPGAVETSWLLTKPLDEEAGGIPHGAGAKIAGVEDGTYISFKTFIEAFESCNGGGSLILPQEPIASIFGLNEMAAFAQGVDAQDGDLTPQGVWRSSLSDNPIGMGGNLDVTLLPRQRQMLSFTVTDSDGNTSVAQREYIPTN